MIKKIIFLLIICSLGSCGFEPVYVKKNEYQLSIKEITLIGDKKINRSIISFTNLKKINPTNGEYIVTITSENRIEIVAKNKLGNASIYRTTIIVNLSLQNRDGDTKLKKFETAFSYNNLPNKFDLAQYQKTIEKNLIDIISEEIIIYLNT